jgi:uncharacterized membrane protein YfcA
MRLLPKGWNPLAFVFWGTIIALPFWLIPGHQEYAIVAIAVVLADIAFLALYLRRSRFAWHVAIVLNIAFAIYRLVGGRHLRVDILVYTILVGYLFIVREPYFQYVSADAT